MAKVPAGLAAYQFKKKGGKGKAAGKAKKGKVPPQFTKKK